jgi:predicted anti-sigma-YlaC factor YlaD
MRRDAHDDARELIALGEGLADAEQARLRAHLDECEACRNYAEAANVVVRSLRSLPLAADSRLVRATQMRVRFHASRLRETRERLWLVGMACLGVGLSATLTVPLLWRLFAWMGAWAGVSSWVWQAGFAFFWIAPTLVVSALLLACGTHLTSTNLSGNNEKQWR